MFEWKVEDMALLNEKSNIFIGREKIYKCEQKLTREDKIAFVDSLQDGILSYILSLIEKFDNEKDNLPKDKWGYVKTVSLKAWLRRNDKMKITDDWYGYGDFRILGLTRDIKRPNEKCFCDAYEDLVDEVFHRQLKECRKMEYSYFLDHDEYSILKRKFNKLNNIYSTTFGVNIMVSSKNDIFIYDNSSSGFDDDKHRDITIDELKYLISKYEELGVLVDKITEETNIKF